MAISRPLVVLACAALAGCASLPPNVAVRAAAERLPTEFRSGHGAEMTDLTNWWNGFSDTQLRALIDKALASNYDLKAAVERSRQAQALITVARADLYPGLDAGSDVSRARTHLPPPAGRVDQSAIGVSGSWDIDIFG